MSYYDELTNEEKMVVNAEIQNSGKNIVVAYLLWFFLGALGGHRFYLGKNGSGLTQALLTILGYATLFFIVGGVLLLALGIWLIMDLFMISQEIERSKEAIKESKAKDYLAKRQTQA